MRGGLLSLVSVLAVGCQVPGGPNPGSFDALEERQEAVAKGEEEMAQPEEAAAEADRWVRIGTTVRGLPIRRKDVGHGPRKVLWIGGIHGNEIEGSVATAKLEDAFLDSGLSSTVSLTMVEDINPDGRAANRRTNANGVDLNRNFPAKNALPKSKPLSQPESRVLHDLILELKPDCVLVAHSWGRKSRGPHRFINFDGPADRLANIFSVISGFPVKVSKHLPATPGSLGSWVGIDMQVPILTIEWARGTPPDQAWIDTREAILAVIRG